MSVPTFSKIMNIANNHALDYGPAAQSETINALRAANLDYDGLPGQIEIVPAGGLKVAFIGTAPYPWAQSLLDIPGTAALVRKAWEQARADLDSRTSSWDWRKTKGHSLTKPKALHRFQQRPPASRSTVPFTWMTLFEPRIS